MRSSLTSSVEIIPGRLGEFRLRIEQVHDAQVGRQPGGKALEIRRARCRAARPAGHNAGEAIAEIGGGGADGVRRHQRIARGAGLPAPFARAASPAPEPRAAAGG